MLGQRRIVARNDMVKGQSGPTQTGPQNFVPWMGSSLYGPYNIKECIRDRRDFHVAVSNIIMLLFLLAISVHTHRWRQNIILHYTCHTLGRASQD
jgi:hypothetical protein